jgi:hypothetical protein
MLGLRRVGIDTREPGSGVEDGSREASTLTDEERRGGDDELICELSVSAIASLVQYQAGLSESFTATFTVRLASVAVREIPRSVLRGCDGFDMELHMEGRG